MRCLALLSLFAAASLAIDSPCGAQEKDNPIEKEVKASLKDLSKPFTMFVFVKVKDGAGAKFEQAFGKAIVGTRKEKGNKTYDLNRSTKNPSEYVVYERWQDFAALQDHMKTSHIRTLLEEIGELLDGPPTVQVLLPASESLDRQPAGVERRPTGTR